MPLNRLWRRILADMIKKYGSRAKWERVFYAMENSGQLKGVTGSEKKKEEKPKSTPKKKAKKKSKKRSK